MYYSVWKGFRVSLGIQFFESAPPFVPYPTLINTSPLPHTVTHSLNLYLSLSLCFLCVCLCVCLKTTMASTSMEVEKKVKKMIKLCCTDTDTDTDTTRTRTQGYANFLKIRTRHGGDTAVK